MQERQRSCAVCHTGVGNNSIYCNRCKLWVHKKCRGLHQILTIGAHGVILGNARPIDGRPQTEVQDRPDKVEVVVSFSYLGDMLSAGGGCEIIVTTRVKTAWKKFRELLPVLTSRHLSYKTRGHAGLSHSFLGMGSGPMELGKLAVFQVKFGNVTYV